MSAYPPPTQILSLFNPLDFETDTADITVGYLDANYLKFPIAQGLENLQKTNITDTTQSTNTTSGSLVTAGGVGIAKNVNIGGQLHCMNGFLLPTQPLVLYESLVVLGFLEQSMLAVS